MQCSRCDLLCFYAFSLCNFDEVIWQSVQRIASICLSEFPYSMLVKNVLLMEYHGTEKQLKRAFSQCVQKLNGEGKGEVLFILAE